VLGKIGFDENLSKIIGEKNTCSYSKIQTSSNFENLKGCEKFKG
jgi:hypothetical protein